MDEVHEDVSQGKKLKATAAKKSRRQPSALKGLAADADYQKLFENSPDAIFLADAERGIIIDVNRAACKLMDMPREELLGLHQSKLHPPGEAERYQAIFREHAQKGEAITQDIYIQRPSGELVPVDISASVIKTSSGKEIVQGVFRDIAQRKRAEEEANRRNEELAALNAIASTVAGSLDLDEILNGALDKVLEVMKVEAGVIALLGAETGEMTLATYRGLSDQFVRNMRSQRQGLAGHVAAMISGGEEAVMIRNLRQDPRMVAFGVDFEEEGLSSSAGAPLLSKGDVVGMLAVMSREPHEFSREEVELLTSIGSQIGMALENARLYRDEGRRLAELEALRETNLDITQQLDVPQLLKSIVRRASDLVGVSGGGLYLYHKDEQELELVVSQYLGEDLTGKRLKVGEGLSGRVVQTGTTIVVEDYAHWKGRSPSFEGAQFRGVVAVPLKWGDEIVGVVNVTDVGQARTFSDRDLRLLELFASQAAIAVKNAQLYQEQQRRNQQLLTLHETSLHISRRLDLGSVLEAIAGQAADLLDGHSAEVYLYRPGKGDLESAGYSRLPAELVGGFVEPGEGVAGKVLQTRKPLIVDDYDSWDGRSERFTGLGFVRVLGVPLRYGRQFQGVLVVDRSAEKPRFNDADVNLVSLLAAQAAPAIENARLLEETTRRLEELSATEEIMGELSSTLNVNKVIHMVLDKAMEATNAWAGSIDIVAEDRSHLIWLAHRGYPPEVPMQYAGFSSMERGIVGRVARTGQLALVDDVRQDPDYMDVLPSTRSQLSVPIVIEGTVAGVIVLESPQLAGFTQQHADFVVHLAEHAAVAMTNARLYQRLGESEERYRAYVENVPDAIWQTDDRGHYTYWSPQVKSLTGYSPEELLGHTPYEFLVYPDDVELLKNRVLQMTQEAIQKQIIRIQALRKNGSIFQMEISIRPLWDEYGRPISYGGVARDVSEEVQLQEQLIQSAKLSAIGQMISGVAHELNNPLTTVMGYTQLLLAGKLDEDVKADLQKVYDDALRAQRIVQDLLIFARQKKPERAPTDVNEAIERTLALRSYELTVDNIELIMELEEDLPWTMADAYQLQQVFLNIINNAQQAMSQRGRPGVFTVRSERVGGDTIRVSFSDTGPGIPPQVLPKIFDPFFSTKEVGTGTGLGLSVSHGIIQEHGGRIWAESEPGSGATFVIELPVISWADELGMPSPDEGAEETAGGQ
jgi:PAS domain S-box-containing protein